MRRKEVLALAYVARDMGTSSRGKVSACDAIAHTHSITTLFTIAQRAKFTAATWEGGW
jgi:hypothetical protein